MKKLTNRLLIIWIIWLQLLQTSNQCTTDQSCYQGECINGRCDCYEGWEGIHCDGCNGRVLLNETSGILTDGPNNYTINKNCSWLIRPSSTNKNVTGTSLLLRINLLSTECGWDYLYIFDGDSLYSPVLATFNGYVYKKGDEDSRELAPELIAQSGQAYITFYSDRAVTSYGFNISYAIRECINDCSGRGTCVDGLCTCAVGYYGDSCEMERCPNNCTTSSHGICSDDGVCICTEGHRGVDCSITDQQGYWSSQMLPPSTPSSSGVSPRASYATVVVDNEVWMFGGLQFDHSPSVHPSIYNPIRNKWRTLNTTTTTTNPEPRYGHSMVACIDSLLVFGGKSVKSERQTCDLWSYNMTSSVWKELALPPTTTNMTSSSPFCLIGHSADIVTYANGTQIMIVMFGDHPELTLNQAVYEYNPVDNTWTRPITTGYNVHGSYGHSTVYDMTSQSIYIYGGYTHMTSQSTEFQLSNRLLVYDVINRHFRQLVSSNDDDVTPVKRYLHSIALLDDVIYVYGGDGHNSSTERKCFMTSLQAYSIACNKWKNLPPFNYQGHAARYGHDSVVLRHNDTSDVIYIMSGYDGEMIPDVIMYHPGRCVKISDAEQCRNASDEFGLSCAWNGSLCQVATSCPTTGSDDDATCSEMTGCYDCLSTSGCSYCGGKCVQSDEVTTCPNVTSHIEACPDFEREFCSRFYTCHQCAANRDRCTWDVVDNSYGCAPYSGNMTSSWECTSSACASHDTCADCSSNTRCMWCMSNQRCFTSTTYLFQYPYGQCLQWHSKESRQQSSTTCPIHKCESLLDTRHCYTHPGCGWCDSGDGTGIGECMDGAGSGPLTNTTHQPDPSLCVDDNWYFVGSPGCPCNGHSSCAAGAGICEPCANNTTGERCDVCRDGYFGEARNGGSCELCDCDGRADTCDPQTGACRCRTKGIVGDKCDQCKTGDTDYLGNASLPNGTCYYPIQQGYQYTFRIGSDVEQYVTQLNFIHLPKSQDDLSLKVEMTEFDGETQSYANIKLAVGEGELPYDDSLAIFYNYSMVEYQFAARLLDFDPITGEARKTFRIYLFDFKTPVYVKISLIQRQHLLLTILLVLFSSFLILLILAAVGWRIKIWYDLRRVRQNRAVEMREMAARPFAQIQLNCGDETRRIEEIAKSARDVIGPQVVSIEKSDSLHLVSVFLWLPSQNNATAPSSSGSSMTSSSANSRDNLYDDVTAAASVVTPPNGQCGLALGTAVTTCKAPRGHQVFKHSLPTATTRRRHNNSAAPAAPATHAVDDDVTADNQRDSRQDFDQQRDNSLTSSSVTSRTTAVATDDDVTTAATDDATTNFSFYDNHAITADNARV